MASDNEDGTVLEWVIYAPPAKGTPYLLVALDQAGSVQLCDPCRSEEEAERKRDKFIEFALKTVEGSSSWSRDDVQ